MSSLIYEGKKMKLTTDLCDEYEEDLITGSLQLLPLQFNMYGKKRQIAGEVTTIKALEDNSMVRKTLGTKGDGRVLLIDGGGSRRFALMGGDLGKLAEKNSWQGVIVFGCIRDVAELSVLDVGVWALGTCPRKSIKKNSGSINENIYIENVLISSGDYCAADEDGVIISKKKLY